MEPEMVLLYFLSGSYPAAVWYRICYGIRGYYAAVGRL